LSLIMVVASSLCAGLPMFGFLFFIWWMDRYDREPIWLLSVTFLWGAIGSIVLAVLFSTLLGELAMGLLPCVNGPDWLAATIMPIIIAPVAEEPSKAAILLLIIWHANFDNMTDGFVYGAAAGLGFGMTENFLYFLGSIDDISTWFLTVIVRTCYSAVMHATATSIIGAALGWARFRGPVYLIITGLMGLATAIALHGVWNGLLTFDEILGKSGQLIGLDFLLLFVIALMTTVVFQICLLYESASIRHELTEEASQGLIPSQHPRIIASWMRRNRRKWLKQGIDREHYVGLVTTLAMRKRQSTQLGRRAPPFYQQEIDRLRREIASALHR
jgi:protease PrsW